ncbi:hypothetical protein ISCGN_026548 [Ixodes scapularis]
MEERDASREIRQTSLRHHASDDQAYRSDEFCHLEASTRYNLALSKYPRAVDIAGPAEAAEARRGGGVRAASTALSVRWRVYMTRVVAAAVGTMTLAKTKTSTDR